MGNSKHSTVSTSSFHDHRHQQQFQIQLKRRQSDPEDYADVQLGRLRSVDFRLGKVLLQSGTISSSGRVDALLLDKLLQPDTFVFSRSCEKNHQGFGFSCEIRFTTSDTFDRDDGGGATESRYVVRQMVKPKRRFQGLEDSPLDIYDVEPQYQRQVLGLVISKQELDNDKMAIEGINIFSIQGSMGQVKIKGDWTSAYEILNSDGEGMFMAQRFNRISGGFEFQIYSVSKMDLAVCIATLVRLEESKFILKIYAPCPPAVKALMMTFTLFLMYLLSR